MAIQPGSPNEVGGTEPPIPSPAVHRGGRKRRPGLAGAIVAVGVLGMAAAGYGISQQFMPRHFTDAQKQRIEAWEVGQRWRTTPKTRLFPAKVHYDLVGQQIGVPGSLKLLARRLGIAKQTPCSRAAAGGKKLVSMLDRDGCQTVLRATYTDSSSSLVLTVGVAVLHSEAGATSAAKYLTGDTATSDGATSNHVLLRPVSVPGTPAAAFGTKQRQLAWVVGSGSYLVMATAGYADGRPAVPVASDSYAYLEMTSLARGVAVDIAAPLGVPPPVPHCPGSPGC